MPTTWAEEWIKFFCGPRLKIPKICVTLKVISNYIIFGRLQSTSSSVLCETLGGQGQLLIKFVPNMLAHPSTGRCPLALEREAGHFCPFPQYLAGISQVKCL